jgi:superfamily II DNA/RNA helicase
VLEPTRELALQVEEAFHKYALFTDLRVTIVYGGVGYGKQTEDLRRGMDILAATPGRLLDHLEQGNCSLDKIDILVLDEVDRMLDMGFLPDVRRIVQKCSKTARRSSSRRRSPGDRAAGRLGAQQPGQGRDRAASIPRPTRSPTASTPWWRSRSSTCSSSSSRRPTSRAC